MKDLCNFIPPKKDTSNIEYYHFVYETNLKTLRQPFVRTNYYIHLVFKGNGTLKTKNQTFRLTPGTMFFSFPYSPIEIESEDDFTYLYISFNGEGVHDLLDNFNINEESCVFANFKHLLDFWMSSVRRITPANANALTESVLLYSLSFIGDDENYALKDRDKFEGIIEYINHNFTDSDISIEKIADMFFYNKKYLSSLFIKRTNVKFTDYLNNMRVNHAIPMLKEQSKSISQISSLCGFSDPLYFSKVFKKITGLSPTQFVKNSK